MYILKKQDIKVYMVNLKSNLKLYLPELRRLRGSNQALKVQIEMIEAFLIELDKLIAFPRIVQV
jgi:hypothetical protein